MALKPQDNEGSVDAANSYADVATLRAYWDDRGVDLSSRTDEEVEVALVKATDFLDARYRWVGVQLRRAQGTQWPRGGVSSYLKGLPPALVNATCLMANRAFTRELMPDPTFDPSGQKVTESTKKVGPIEVSLKFAESTGASLTDAVPQYPEVTLMLQGAGLIGSSNSGQLARA